VGDDSGAPVSSGWLTRCVLFIRLSLEHLCWIKDDKFSSLCVTWDWQDGWMSESVL
jgi:hypothetical protein